MLFRKSIFTLEGVLNDLCPTFDMDTAAAKYMTDLMTEEIPLRIGNFFHPFADRPENYPSLISNAQLQSLIVHQYASAVNSVMRTWTEALFGHQKPISSRF